MRSVVTMGCFQILGSLLFKGQFCSLVNATSQCVLSPTVSLSLCVCVCVCMCVCGYVWFGKFGPQICSTGRHVPPWLTQNDMCTGFGNLIHILCVPYKAVTQYWAFFEVSPGGHVKHERCGGEMSGVIFALQFVSGPAVCCSLVQSGVRCLLCCLKT